MLSHRLPVVLPAPRIRPLADQFRRWQREGIWTALNDRLRALVRAAVGKPCRPTAALLNRQTVRSADHPSDTGYDAAKKTKGRKRHLLVDTMG